MPRFTFTSGRVQFLHGNPERHFVAIPTVLFLKATIMTPSKLAHARRALHYRTNGFPDKRMLRNASRRRAIELERGERGVTPLEARAVGMPWKNVPPCSVTIAAVIAHHKRMARWYRR